ncbi:MAG: ABC transporter ATP-binding protein [Parvibaculaceae bacterium]
MSASFELRSIEKNYGPLRVIDKFSLTIAPGEFLTLLGPSGSGKTTILKMVAGFEAPSAGEIRLDGRSIVNLPPYERGIGMVFQNYALFPHMTIAENVGFPLMVRKKPAAEQAGRVRDVLKLVRMEGYDDRYPNQLSGGQQQRIALARALVFSPSILLMDEPLSALDRNLRHLMKSEIMRIQKELSITVLFVTHDQDEALTMSDRIAVMKDGALEQVGDGPTLYNDPANRFVAQFIGESNLLPCAASSFGDGSAAVAVAGRHCGRARMVAAPGSGGFWLFLRPEHIRIQPGSSAGRDGCGALEGTVSQSLFLGEMMQYSVSCGDLVLTVKCQNNGQETIATGSAVTLSWSPSHAIVLD